MNVQARIPNKISRTLLIPLWCCASPCGLNPDAAYDPLAAKLLARLEYDFSRIQDTFGECGQVTTLAREWNVDRAVREFTAAHPRGCIVNLGCGLSTAGYRTPLGRVAWYDLDLPEVIRLREALLPQVSGHYAIAGSLLDSAWMDEIPFSPDTGVLLLAMGVFHYFPREHVRAVITEAARRFPGGSLLFDAVSGLGRRGANLYVRKSGNNGAPMLFSASSPAELRAWSPRIKARLLPYFPDLRGRDIGLAARCKVFLIRKLKLARLFALDFAAGPSGTS